MKRITLIAVCIITAGLFTQISAQDFISSGTPAFRILNRFVGGIELCVSPSRTITEEMLTPTAINFRAGYKMKSTTATASMGVEYMNGENFIPISVELKQNFSQNIWAPYAYARAGYSLHLKRNINSRYYTADYDQYDPAFFFNVGVGYGIVTSLNEFYFSLGYQYHGLEKFEVNQDGEERTDLTMNGVSLTVGFTF